MPSDNFLWFPAAASGGLLTGASPQPVGETTDAYFSTKKALEIQSFNFSVEQSQTIGSASSGAGAGKAKFNEFTVKKVVDAASAPLYQACAAGAHFPQIYLAVRKAGGAPLIYLEYIFSMVFVTGITWDGGSGDEAPSEEIKFIYGALGIQYQRQGPDGKQQGPPAQAKWSIVTNNATLDVPGNGGPAPNFDDPGSSLPK